MTTTDHPARRPEPRIRLSSLEWRLYLTALLSGSYAIAWIALAARAPRVTAAAPPPSGPAVTQASSVWIGDLPPSARPAISLPPGWVVATPGKVRPALVRRVTPPNPRIRTRAS